MVVLTIFPLPDNEGVSSIEDVDMLRGKMDNSRVSYYLENTAKLDNGCMLWMGGTSQGDHGRTDYAVAEIHGEKFYVHRYVAIAPYNDEERQYFWDHSEIDTLHSCDTKLCINPEHVSLGTQSQNMSDAIAKGLKVMPRGSEHGRAILTEEDVLQIRYACANRLASQRELAKVYGVSQPTISAIAVRRIWAHL